MEIIAETIVGRAPSFLYRDLIGGGNVKDLARTLFSLLLLLIPTITAAQATYPEKPIRMIVGFPVGTQMDTIARLLGQSVAETFGKPFVIDNIVGVGGSIAAERLAKALPDGYTFGLVGPAQIAIGPSLHKVAYDSMKDFSFVTLVAAAPFLLVVHTGLPAKNVQELVKLAKAHPGEITYASAGLGTGIHMATEYFKSAAHVDIRHIPYRGVVAAMPDLLSGRVMMTFSPIATGLPVVRAGKLRALAVTSLRRSSAATEIPTVAESGYPGFECSNWFGLVGPGRIPAAIVDRLHAGTIKALASPDVRAKLIHLGVESIGGSADELAALVDAEIPRWAKLIKALGVKAD
jgi:tripartite-type tricarboxylate transporter receptor subunit TctC